MKNKTQPKITLPVSETLLVELRQLIDAARQRVARRIDNAVLAHRLTHPHRNLAKRTGRIRRANCLDSVETIDKRLRRRIQRQKSFSDASDC